MKKLFFAIALTGFVGAATINTASAITHTKIILKGGDNDKKKKDSSKDKTCCKSTGTASATGTATEAKSCTGSATHKCCKGKTEAKETSLNDKTTSESQK